MFDDDDEMVTEAEDLGTADLTVLLYRSSRLADLSDETLWISGYDAARLVVHTFPRVPIAPGAVPVGVVREVPLTARRCVDDAIAAAVSMYEALGWHLADVASYPA